MNFLDRLENWMVKPYRAQGMAEGRVQGRNEASAEYEDWLNRKAQAEADGRPFNEPPPSATPKPPVPE